MTAAQMPDGLGFFYQSSDMVADPEVSAQKMLDSGATHAWVLCSSVDGRMQPVARVARQVAALHARNIRAGLYFFPVDKTTLEHEAHLDACSKYTGVIDVCADIEPWHEHDDMRTPVNEDEKHDWSRSEIRDLFARLRAKGHRLAISVFPRKQWRELDWKEVLGGSDVLVLLQLYKTIAGPVIALAHELNFWRSFGLRVVICVGSYLGDAARFRRDLHVAEEHSSVQQIDVWALGTTDKAERAAALMFVVEAWPAP